MNIIRPTTHKINKFTLFNKDAVQFVNHFNDAIEIANTDIGAILNV